jgi:hypothetical protein
LIKQNEFYAVLCVGIDKKVIQPLSSLDQCRDGHLYNFFPIGVALLAAPEVYVIRKGAWIASAFPWLARRVKNPYRRQLLEGDLVYTHPLVETTIASLWIGISAALVYWTARRFLSVWRAVSISLVFSFCTPAWSTASRALWQHGGSILMISIVLLAVLKTEIHSGWLALAGGAAAFSVIIRPSNLVFFVAISIYVLRTCPGRRWIFFAPALPIFATFVLWSYSAFGLAAPPYYWPVRPGGNSLALHGQLIEALAANLVSPGRGLFVYVPVFLFSIAGLCSAVPDAVLLSLRPYLLSVLAAYWILVSTFRTWWGGFAFGPRYLSDVTPIFVILLIPVIQTKSKRILAAFFLLAAVSGAIQFLGANRQQTFDWNRFPVSIDANPQRVWDWSDVPFLR